MLMLAKNIRTLRKEHNMSQDELAQKLQKKSYTTIQKWESGVSEPSVSDVYRMAELFGMSMSEMVNENIETMSPKEKELIAVFKNLNEENKDKLLRIAHSMTDLQIGDEILSRVEKTEEREKMA